MIAMILILPINVKAIELDNILEEQLNIFQDNEIKELINQINQEHEDIIPPDIRSFVNIMRGKEKYDYKTLLKSITSHFFKELHSNFHIMGKLIALSLVCAVFRSIQNAFQDTNISKVTYSVVYLAIITIALKSFYLALSIGKEAIDKMVSFVQAIMPIILAMLASIGGLSSMAIFNPIIFVGITIASTWIRDILLPIAFVASVLSLVNNLSEHIQISYLSSFLKQICILLIGVFMSVFLGILVVSGAASSTVDGITIRTAKFASKNFVPIVGGILSDTVDTIVGCSLILKNAIGIMGLLAIVVITVFPVIKIIALVFIFRLASAVTQPVGEVFLSKCLKDMANSLMIIFVSIISVAVMFFVALSVILAAGNITTLLR